MKKSILLLASIGALAFASCRNANTDDKTNLNSIFTALIQIQKETNLDIVLPLHPRTKKMMAEYLDETIIIELEKSKKIKIIPPVGFLDIISLEKNSKLIVTDSGGMQKEAFFFQKPCVILRPETEWIEIVENGNAILANADEQKIVESTLILLNKTDFTYPELYGDGKVADFILTKISEYCQIN